jgi:hypothetical protein
MPTAMEPIVGSPRLKAIEFVLRRQLRAEGASPFAAHLEPSPSDATAIEHAATTFVAGQEGRIPRFIEAFPAAGTWFLVRAVAESYGRDDHAIYPAISRAFAVSSIGIPVRTRLNSSFRQACRRLGLGVASLRPTGAVDDYLFQAGVSLAQYPALVEAFVRAEAAYGPPPDDDTRDMNSWEDRAIDLAPPGLTRMRNILIQDEYAYHALCFARVSRGEAATGIVERLMRDHLEPARTRLGSAKVLGLPSLAFIDETLVIVAPPRAGIRGRAAGWSRTIPAGSYRALPTPWPDRVEWEWSDGDSTEFESHEMAVFGADRRILVFDPDSGRLLRIVTTEAATKPVPIDITSALLVARLPFAVADEAAVSIGTEAFARIVDTSHSCAVSIGGDVLHLTVAARPLIEVELPRAGRSIGGPLCGSPTEIRIRFPAGRLDGALDLLIQHPSLSAPHRLPVPSEQDVVIDVADVLQPRGPAGLLRVALVVSEGQRMLVRSSHWVWPGFVGLSEGTRFEAAAIPANVNLDQSCHVVRGSDDRLCLDLTASFRVAALAFRDGERGTRIFEFARPGLTVAVVSETGVEHLLPLGSSLAVSTENRDMLAIRCTDEAVDLDVRGVVEERPFGRSGVRRLALATLIGAAPHDEIRTVHRLRSEASQTLLRVLPATAPSLFVVDSLGTEGGLRVRCDLTRPVDAVRLVMTDVATGQQIEDAVALGRFPLEVRPRGFLRGESNGATTPRLTLRIAPPRNAGPCIGEISVRIEGTDHWHPFIDAHGRRHLLGTGARSLAASDIGDQRELYTRLTDVVETPIAEAVRATLAPIEALWTSTGRSLAATDEGRRHLLQTLMRPLSIDRPADHLPLHHPLEVAPDLFSLPADAYEISRDDVGSDLREATALSLCRKGARVRDAMAAAAVDPRFAYGFRTFAEAAKCDTIPLRDFDFSRYRDAIAGTDDFAALWRPRQGRLTGAHHVWCLLRLCDRIDETVDVEMTDGADEIAPIPHAIQLARAAHMLGHRIALSTPSALIERVDVAETLPSLFSYAARACRRGDAQSAWVELSRRTETSPNMVRRRFGLLTRLAPELWGFYLLFWELEGLSGR